MKRVLVFGTFDILHKGHLFFLRKARSLGDHLTASVARDAFVEERKGSRPVHSQEKRMALVRRCEWVDAVYLADEVPGTFSLVERINPAIICLGYDQTALKEQLEIWARVKRPNLQIVVLEPYKAHKYKSSILKRLKNLKHHTLAD